MSSLPQYLYLVDHSYQTCQGLTLAQLLSLSDAHVHDKTLYSEDIATQVASQRTSFLNDLIINHLLCVRALHKENFVEAFNHQLLCMGEVMTMLRNQRGANWMMPLMYAVCLDLRIAAQRADAVSHAKGEILAKAAQSLMVCLQICAEDTTSPEEDSKRVGVLGAANNLLRIYMRLRQFNMCRSVIQAIEYIVEEGHFPKSQLVPFRFFVGRMAVQDGDFIKAEKNLTFAFNHCYANCFRNKRTILTYLLPVKMLHGYMPVKYIVEKYNLPLFWYLLCVIKNGQLVTFDDIVNTNRRYFAYLGLINALQNLKIVAYRNVLKNVYLSLRNYYIPFATFQMGLELMSQKEMDMSKVHKLLSTLIYTHRIRGSMSFTDNMVVFYSDDPFPRLSELRCVNYRKVPRHAV